MGLPLSRTEQSMNPFSLGIWMFCGLSLAAQSVRPLAEWKSRYPWSKTAGILLKVRLEEEPMGFWKGPKEHTISHHRTSLVLKSDLSAWRVFQQDLDTGSTITEGWVSWTLPDGKTEKVEFGKFKVVDLGPDTRYSYKFPPLPEGTQIEEHLVAQVPGSVWRTLHQPFPENAPMLETHLEAVLQKGKSFRIKNPLAEEAGRGRVKIQDHADGKRMQINLDLEEFGPSVERRVQLAHIPALPKDVSLQIADPQHFYRTPEAMIAAVYSNIAARTPWFSTVVQDRLASIVNGRPSVRGKVESVFGYLNKEMTVLPESAEKGSIFSGNYRLDFADMLTQMRGTPGAIAALLNQMLQKLEIDSKLVLIHGGLRSQFDPACLDEDEIWKLAVLVDLEGSPTILFPQDKARPMGQVDFWLMDRPAIVVQKDNELRVIRTPHSQPLPNRYEESWKLEVSPNGKGKLHFERSAMGPENHSIRAVYRQASDYERNKVRWLFDLTPASPYAPPPDKGAMSAPDSLDKPITTSFDFSLPQICAARDKVITLSPWAAPFTFGLEGAVPLNQAVRQLPIWIPYDQTTHRTLVITVPAGWSLQTPIPAPVRLENALGSCSSSYSLENGAIKVDQTLMLKHGMHPAVLSKELDALLGDGSPLLLPAFQFK